MATKKVTPTLERVKELLDYDPETGVFRWKKITSHRVKVGDVVGYRIKSGHILVGIDGRRYCVHQIAWFVTYGEWPAHEVDHKDGDPGNNRITNLRAATHAQNLKNQRKPKNNTSGYKGVRRSTNGKRWWARLKVDYKEIYIGAYDTAEEAARAYDEAAVKHYGEFARTNFDDRTIRSG